MEVETTSTTLTARLPILNPGEYDLWLMRIEQYFLMTDYSLWEDIRNEMKSRGTLLMALPNKDQLKFHSYKDRRKLLMEAIEKRLQKLISQLEIQGEVITQEDINLKLLRSLPSEWKTHALIWRNKEEIETISLDDFSNSNSSTNEADNTTYGVSAAHTQSNPTSVDNLREDLENELILMLEEMDLQCGNGDAGQLELRRFIKRDRKKLISPPYTGNFIPFKPDLTFMNEIVEIDAVEKPKMFVRTRKLVVTSSNWDWNRDDARVIMIGRSIPNGKDKLSNSIWLDPQIESVYGASLDRKSTTGGCQFLGKRLISWQCKKRTIVANSTTEAEYVAAANICGQLIIHIEALFEGRLYGTMCISAANYTSRMLRMECKSCQVMNMGLELKEKKELAIPGQTTTGKEFSNPLMADSLPKTISAKFWNTATSKTVNSIKQIHAIVDGMAVVISKSSVRNDLLFDDEDGITCLTNDDISENLTLMGVERAITTDASFVAAHDSDNIIRTQTTAMPNVDIPQGMDTGGSPRRQETMGGVPAQTRMAHNFELMDIVPPTPYDSPLPGGYTPRSDEGRLKLEELMDMCTKLSKQVLDLEKEKDAQAVEIFKLKKRVKKLERQRKSSISHPRRRIYSQVKSSDDDLDEEDASK
ncbi:hypothetical protein Tco_1238591 [Tanacetum coccineum]